jgi:hypothetical protein
MGYFRGRKVRRELAGRGQKQFEEPALSYSWQAAGVAKAVCSFSFLILKKIPRNPVSFF